MDAGPYVYNHFADRSRLFIVDGIISLPIAIAGFFVLPDVPETTKAWYLSEEVRMKGEVSTTILTIALGKTICEATNAL
jgi:hypothetical protein